MAATTQDHNLSIVVGTVAADSTDRQLAAGNVVRSFDLSVVGEERSSVPIAWWDPPARRAPLSKGQRVVVVGNVRRRFFRAQGATVSRTEVVATTVASATAGNVAKAHAAVAFQLEEPDLVS